MGIFEIVVYGGGEYYRDVFNGVAMLAGTNGISSLIRLAMIVGLIMGLLKAVLDFNVGAILKWFIIATITYGVLWVPKVQVHITDKFNPALVGADVANVPLGVGVAASIASTVGDRVIQLTELTFSDPNDVSYSSTGMIFGAKVFEGMKDVHIIDPLFSQNMQSFIQSCVVPDVVNNHYSMGALANANDIWTFISQTNPPNPALSMQWSNPAGSSPTTTIIPCSQAATQLDAQWSNDIPNEISTAEAHNNPGEDSSTLLSNGTQHMSVLAGLAQLASTDAQQNFRQLAMINALKQGMATFAAESGDGSLSVLAETQAQAQTKNTQLLLGQIAGKAIPMLKIVVDLLFIGMFPVLFPAFLLPGIGLQMTKGYLTGFIYLQLWGPMYVILNKIATGYGLQHTTAAVQQAGLDNAIRLGNLDGVTQANSDIAAIAGSMMMMIPVLAGLLTKGAMAVGAQGEALLGQFRSGADAAGAMMTTGNFNYGNTSVDNHSFNNVSGNRWSTSPDVDTSRASYVDSSGVRHTYNGDGSQIATAPMSQLPISMRASEGISSALTNAASHSRQLGQALEHADTQATSRVGSTISEWSRSKTTADGHSTTRGADDRSSTGEMVSTLDQATASVAQHYGISTQEAKARVARAAAEMSLSGGAQTPIGGIGARGTVGVEASGTHTDSAVARDDYAHNTLRSLGFTEKAERARADYVQDSVSHSSTLSDQDRQAVSNTVSHSSSVSDAKRKFENEAVTYDQRADYARTNSAAIDENYNNVAFDKLREKLIGQRDYNNEVITEDRFNQIIAGHTGADMKLMRSSMDSVWKDLSNQVQVPGQLDQARAATGGDRFAGGTGELGGTGAAATAAGVLEGAGAAAPAHHTTHHSHGVPHHGHAEEQQAVATRTPEGHPQHLGEQTGVFSPGGDYRLPPGFQSPERDRMQADVRHADQLLDERPAPKTPVNILHPDENILGKSQQNSGGWRLGQRHGTDG